MGRVGIEGVFIYVAFVGGPFAIFAAWRSLHVEAPERRERPFLVLNESMSQQIAHVAEEQGT